MEVVPEVEMSKILYGLSMKNKSGKTEIRQKSKLSSFQLQKDIDTIMLKYGYTNDIGNRLFRIETNKK